MGVIKKRGITYAGGGGGELPDYSTTEQKTGRKWIDGRDIWEKTIVGTTIVGGATTRKPHGISDLSVLIDCTIMAHFQDNGYWRALNFAYNNGLQINYDWYGGYAIDQTDILFQIGVNFAQFLDKWYATIQYVKSS